MCHFKTHHVELFEQHVAMYHMPWFVKPDSAYSECCKNYGGREELVRHCAMKHLIYLPGYSPSNRDRKQIDATVTLWKNLDVWFGMMGALIRGYSEMISGEEWSWQKTATFIGEQATRVDLADHPDTRYSELDVQKWNLLELTPMQQI